MLLPLYIYYIKQIFTKNQIFTGTNEAYEIQKKIYDILRFGDYKKSIKSVTFNLEKYKVQ